MLKEKEMVSVEKPTDKCLGTVHDLRVAGLMGVGQEGLRVT